MVILCMCLNMAMDDLNAWYLTGISRDLASGHVLNKNEFEKGLPGGHEFPGGMPCFCFRGVQETKTLKSTTTLAC